MNKQEIIDKYKDIILTFSIYYKYEFIYKTVINNKELIAYVGGDSEDIYRLELSKEENLYKLAEDIKYIAIEQEDGSYINYN